MKVAVTSTCDGGIADETIVLIGQNMSVHCKTRGGYGVDDGIVLGRLRCANAALMNDVCKADGGSST